MAQAGGSGVFVAKDDKTGEWSEPAFFTMGPPVSAFNSARRCRRSCCWS